MPHKNIFCVALSAALLLVVAGCVVEPIGQPAYVAPVQVQPVGIEGGLVYYPNYEVYFDPGRNAYWYNRGGVWVTGLAPEGISVDVLLRSPSVRMDFRDSPANHHGEVVRRYPHDWHPDDRRGR